MFWCAQPLPLLGQPDFFIGYLVLTEKVAFEGGKGALLDGRVHSLHQLGDKTQVVYRSQPVSQQFLAFK
jgi:hypothetical protein